MKVISFFSYKGGAGRSTLAYNVIPLLAANHIRPTAESPMIVIDTDVDSCGMLRAEDKVTDTNCLQYLLHNGIETKKYPSISEHPFLSQLIPVGNAYGYPVNDAILLLPAMDNKNIDKESKSNYSDANNSFYEKLESFINVCDRFFDIPAIVLDSSVGNTATANISNYAANVVVCCMRPTIQFVNGTRRFFTAVEDGDKSIGEEKTVIFVPNVIPKYSTTINGVTYPGYAIDKISGNFESSFGGSDLRHKYILDMLDREEFGIPAVDRFMWQEDQLYSIEKDKLMDDEKEALERYKKLARIIDEVETD